MNRILPFATLSFMLLGLALLLLTKPLPAEEPNKLTPDEIASGWILLFDGETLFG